MPLVEVPFAPDEGPIPRDVLRFLRAADRRIERFAGPGRPPAFVPSDYPGAYRALKGLAGSPALRGTRFLEWGSGFGVVAGLAAGLGYDAHGIEADADLVARARMLADDFGLAVEFAHGSFVPPGGEPFVLAGGEYAWLTTESDTAYDDLGLDPDDFDLVFAYPWPDEEAVVGDLFEKYGGAGAVLLTYHGGEFRLRRRARKKPGRRRG